MAQRVLGRIAQTTDDEAEAARSFQDALATFSAIQSKFELAARTST